MFLVITVALFPAKSNNEVLVIGGSESLTADCRQVSLVLTLKYSLFLGCLYFGL